MSEPVVATMADVRALKLCASGVRTWLTHHGLDVATFMTRGLPAEELEATGDHFGLAVAAAARKRAAQVA